MMLMPRALSLMLKCIRNASVLSARMDGGGLLQLRENSAADVSGASRQGGRKHDLSTFLYIGNIRKKMLQSSWGHPSFLCPAPTAQSELCSRDGLPARLKGHVTCVIGRAVLCGSHVPPGRQ